jgi:hypothetical protein
LLYFGGGAGALVLYMDMAGTIEWISNPGMSPQHACTTTGSSFFEQRIGYNNPLDSGMDCDDRSSLLRKHELAMGAYARAVRELSEERGTCSAERYTSLKDAAEATRLSCMATRLALDQHASNHKCVA